MYINLVHLNNQDRHEETYAGIIVFTIFITNRMSMKIYMYTHNRRGANAHVTIAT